MQSNIYTTLLTFYHTICGWKMYFYQIYCFRFDIRDNTGELHAERPVPFRLTPNVAEFISPVGVSSVLSAAMVATARCFLQPNFKVKI